jgi:hypothetical protein
MSPRCMLNWHDWQRRLLRYRTIRRHQGVWLLEQECTRCGSRRLIEGRAAEIKAHISSS